MWTDFLLCVASIAIAAIFQLPTILIRLWPYILLLSSFAGFVFWNGGVVLGNLLPFSFDVKSFTNFDR